jgi:hypothetical protein
MSISNYLENELLDAVFNAGSFSVATPYVSLHTGDPAETGANEVVGGSYGRQVGSFTTASGGAVTTDGNTDFTLMPSATVTYAGSWDAISGGNFLWGGPFLTGKAVNSGDTFRIPTGDLDIALE